jgi:hypothetical protein
VSLVRVCFFLCGVVVPGLALDREAFTFTEYDLSIRIEAEQQRLAAEGKITLRNDSASPQKNLSLQISSTLGWRAIQIANKPAQFLLQTYTSDIDHTGALSEAIVTLPKEVPVGGTVELELRYEGTVGLDATRLIRIGVPEERSKHSDWDQISDSSIAMRGVGYVVWYPVAMDTANLSEGNEVFERLGGWKHREALGKMLLHVRIPTRAGTEPLDIVAGAPECEVRMEAMGAAPQSSADCKFNQLGLFSPTIIAGQYDILNSSAVRVHYFSEHKNNAESYIAASAKCLPIVTEWFGTPKRTADLADLADPKVAPFESGPLLLASLTSFDAQIAEITAMHQFTHAVFSSPRLWIYEGLAHFAQAVYVEKQQGRSPALDFLGQHRPALVEAEKALSEKQDSKSAADQSLINTSTEEFTRSKASYVWWMLRDMVGEIPLKKAVASYRGVRDRDPAYMPGLVGAQAQRDLQWFFDDWVYRDRGLPDFRVQSVYPRQMLPDGYMVTVSVENLGSAGAEVPVVLKTPEGDLTKRLQIRAKTTASVRFQVLHLPTEVVVNDGSVPESDISNNRFAVQASTK